MKQLKILPYRDRFAEISQGLINEFLEKVNSFVQRFYEEGPYSVEGNAIDNFNVGDFNYLLVVSLFHK